MRPDDRRIVALGGYPTCIQFGLVNMLTPINPRIMSTPTAVMMNIARLSALMSTCSSWSVIESSLFAFDRWRQQAQHWA
jgi:hypothetical protein